MKMFTSIPHDNGLARLARWGGIQLAAVLCALLMTTTAKAVWVSDGNDPPNPAYWVDIGDTYYDPGDQDWLAAFNDAMSSGQLIYFYGGIYNLDGVDTYIPGQYTCSTDSDGDGIPDTVDPYPTDSFNHYYSYVAPGYYNYDGVEIYISGTVMLHGTNYTTDSNGYPDGFTEMLEEAIYYGPSWADYWGGGRYTLSDSSVVTLDPILYICSPWNNASNELSMGDDDGDGIPNFYDPEPFIYDSPY